MQIERMLVKDVTLIRVTGEIVLGRSAERFSDFLKEVLEGGARSVLLDLSDIDYVDSTGLGELVGYLHQFRAQGRTLRLLNPKGTVRKLLELSGLSEVFRIYDDRAQALESMNRTET